MPEFIDNGFIVSRHLDDKAGVAIMLASLEAMQRLKVETPVDTYWLFTIGEGSRRRRFCGCGARHSLIGCYR